MKRYDTLFSMQLRCMLASHEWAQVRWCLQDSLGVKNHGLHGPFGAQAVL